jgi:hypothetical protein
VSFNSRGFFAEFTLSTELQPSTEVMAGMQGTKVTLSKWLLASTEQQKVPVLKSGSPERAIEFDCLEGGSKYSPKFYKEYQADQG